MPPQENDVQSQQQKPQSQQPQQQPDKTQEGFIARLLEKKWILGLLLFIGVGFIFLNLSLLLDFDLFSPSQRTLFSLDPGDTIDEMRIVSTNPLRYYAIVSTPDQKQYAVWSGEKSPTYSEITSWTASPNGEHFAYVANSNNSATVVYDGTELATYERARNLTFSPDGNRFAYIGTDECLGCDSFVVIDGNKQKSYPDILGTPIFSPDSQQLAYVALTDELEQIVVLDDQEDATYTTVTTIHFSPANELAYVVQDTAVPVLLSESGAKRFFLLYGGKEGERFDGIKELTFSPDGQHVAYAAALEDRWVVVRNNEAHRPSSLQRERRDVELSDGELALPFPQDDLPLNIPQEILDTLPPEVRTRFLTSEVVEKNEKDAYVTVKSLSFSPNGEHLLFIAGLLESKEFVSVIQDNDIIGGGSSVFEPISSPDSERFAYVTRKGFQAWLVVVDGENQELYRKIDSVVFSSDSQSLAYRVDTDCQATGCKQAIAIDGVALDEHEKVSPPFVTDTELYYLAQQDNDVVQIRTKFFR